MRCELCAMLLQALQAERYAQNDEEWQAAKDLAYKAIKRALEVPANPHANMLEYWLKDYAQFRPNWWPLIQEYLAGVSRDAELTTGAPNPQTE